MVNKFLSVPMKLTRINISDIPCRSVAQIVMLKGGDRTIPSSNPNARKCLFFFVFNEIIHTNSCMMNVILFIYTHDFRERHAHLRV